MKLFGLDLNELCLDEIKLCYASKLLESAERLITFVLVLILSRFSSLFFQKLPE